MSRVKEIIVSPIASKEANKYMKIVHYSGKVVSNSQIHLGLFLEGKLGGCLQFGPSLDKRKMLNLVSGTKWNEFLELNRMALSDWMPRNSESRCIAISLKIIKKEYPWMKWVISYADACQCGDGTIYRASGFYLTAIKENKDLKKLPNGLIVHSMSQKTGHNKLDLYAKTRGRSQSMGTPIKGFQLRYIYFLHPEEKKNLTVPIIPFSKIEEVGARMYKGKCVTSIDSDVPVVQTGEGGASPTVTLNGDNK